MKKIKILCLLLLLVVSNALYAQTFSLNTNHTSISIKVKNLGWTADVFVTNNHLSETYIVSYTIEFSLKCGGTKTYSQSRIGIKAGKTDDEGGYTISIPDVKGCEKGISGARLLQFSAEKGATKSTINDNNLSQKNSAPTNLDNKGTTSAPVVATQVTKTTSSSTEPRYNTNPAVKEAVERQNRLKALQEQQQQQQKSQQQANYDKAVAYEQQRRKDMDQTSKTVDAITGALTDLIKQRAEERERRRAEEERRDEERRQRQLEEDARLNTIKQKINNRKAAIAEFPSKDIPLGYKEKAANIYYFIYAYDNNLGNETGATVYVSNVFEIGLYSDGTRAYTATVKNEIINLTPYEEVLHGYYYSEQEAENFRATLVTILKNNGVNIENILYKGKPSTKKESSTTNTTNNNDSKYGKTVNINDPNFAPAKLNGSKPTEVPKRNIEKAEDEEKKKQNKYGKTIKID